MTPTPNLQAAAMRTRATDVCKVNGALAARQGDNFMPHQSDAHSILALPLEATHAELLAEAVELAEVRALVEFAEHVADGDSADYTDNWKLALAALAPFARKAGV